MPVEPKFRYRRSAVNEARHGQERVIATRRRPRRKLVTAIVVILLLVPAGLLALQSAWTAATDGVPDPELAPPPPPPAPTLDAANPFDRTRADTLPLPQVGILLPTTRQMGPWPAKTVQNVLERTRAILIGARTNPAVLAGNPAGYVAQLAPNTRRATAASIARGTDALGYVTRLAPGYQVQPEVRAAGSLTVRGGRQYQLIVTAEVVWVYPLVGPLAKGAKGAGTRLIVLHSVESYEWFPSKGFAPADQGARPGDGERKVFAADCGLYARGYLGLRRTGVVKDPVKGRDALFAPSTTIASFPASC